MMIKVIISSSQEECATILRGITWMRTMGWGFKQQFLGYEPWWTNKHTGFNGKYTGAYDSVEPRHGHDPVSSMYTLEFIENNLIEFPQKCLKHSKTWILSKCKRYVCLSLSIYLFSQVWRYPLQTHRHVGVPTHSSTWWFKPLKTGHFLDHPKTVAEGRPSPTAED